MADKRNRRSRYHYEQKKETGDNALEIERAFCETKLTTQALLLFIQIDIDVNWKGPFQLSAGL